MKSRKTNQCKKSHKAKAMVKRVQKARRHQTRKDLVVRSRVIDPLPKKGRKPEKKLTSKESSKCIK